MSEKYIRFAADKLSRAGFTDIQYVTDDEQGADILATAKSGAHVCIKCVYTDKPVTASVVNEVYQAKKAYGYNAAMVITNSTFTEKAEEFAGKAKVSLKANVVAVSRPAPPPYEPKKRRSTRKIVGSCIFGVTVLFLAIFIPYSIHMNNVREEEYRNSPEGQYWAQKLKESEEAVKRSEELLQEIEEIGTEAEKTVADIESIGDIEVENKLLTVTLTMPADFVGETTQEELEESAKETGNFISVKLNDDGTATYVMTKSAHKELMDTTRAGFEQQLQEMVRSEDYPKITEIKVNDDFTKFEVTTENEEPDFAESFSTMLFYMMSGTYHVFNGTQPDNCQVIFYNAQTGAIIQEANSSELGD